MLNVVSQSIGKFWCGSLWLAVNSLLFGAQIPPSPNVTIGWTASPDPTAVGYYVYYGASNGVSANKVDVGTNTLLTFSGLAPGSTYYFEATSYNAARVESIPTTQLAYVVPGGLIVTGLSANSAAITLQFAVAPSNTYELQVSSDLKSWSTLWTFTNQNSNGWVQYSDPFTNTTQARFYRLVSP